MDVDVHHGDGVQEIFWDDPRVLTISLHETPLALFPGTGFPARDRRARAPRAARSTSPCRRAPTTPAGCARSTPSCRRRCARSGPQILFTQCGADTHRLDPLADLRLTVDGQRAVLPRPARPGRRAVRRPVGRHRRRRLRAGRGGAAGLDPPARDRHRGPAAAGDADHPTRSGGSSPSGGLTDGSRRCGASSHGPGHAGAASTDRGRPDCSRTWQPGWR